MKCPADMKQLRYEVKFALCAAAHFIAPATSYGEAVFHSPKTNFIEIEGHPIGCPSFSAKDYLNRAEMR